MSRTSQLHLKTSANIKLLKSSLYDDSFIKFINSEMPKQSEISQFYKYICVNYADVFIQKIHDDVVKKKYNIAKYIPLSNKFYVIHEISENFGIFKNLGKSARIAEFGFNCSTLEYLRHANYHISKVDFILLSSIPNNYQNQMETWKSYLDNIKKIYRINIIDIPDSIYDLINSPQLEASKYDIISYHLYSVSDRKNAYIYESFYNAINIFVGALSALKFLTVGGSFILYIGSVAYKHLADVYLILKPFFTASYLYYPEIAVENKPQGVQAIYKHFKGCSVSEMAPMIAMLSSLQKRFSNDLRDLGFEGTFAIAKHGVEKMETPQITEFLNIPASDPIYDEIRTFNKLRYLRSVLFLEKLQDLKDSPKTDLPTNEQLISSILYCRKYNIPYFDKFSKKLFEDQLGRDILSEMFGYHEPIKIRIKTAVPAKPTPNKTRKTRKQIPEFSKANEILAKYGNGLGRGLGTPPKSYKRMKETSLIDKLFDINNRTIQVGRLIDSRKDFSKPSRTKDKFDPQQLNWAIVNKTFRYYKHSSDIEKTHLDVLVRKTIGDNRISQAWLKMMEILVDCNIIQDGSGIYRSFHFCEAPGTFINCLNYYIHTKTHYKAFDWMAQSLSPIKGNADIGDDYNLIKNYPDRWNWGADETGDISNPANIEHYRKLTEGRDIQLITSDCGVPSSNPNYVNVAFHSLLAILTCLPRGGSMIYKILTPIDSPAIWNAIYQCYCNFKELIFFKPVQNLHSREFYIIGKGYSVADVSLLSDPTGDSYPREFVEQILHTIETIDTQYIYAIERNIYYLDNFKQLKADFIPMAKHYFDEKNADWMAKYKIAKLPKGAGNSWML